MSVPASVCASFGNPVVWACAGVWACVCVLGGFCREGTGGALQDTVIHFNQQHVSEHDILLFDSDVISVKPDSFSFSLSPSPNEQSLWPTCCQLYLRTGLTTRELFC